MVRFVIGKAPGGRPLLGHAAHLRRDPLGFFMSIRSCGDIVVIKIGKASAYVLNHPELMRRMLVDEARNFKRGAIAQRSLKLVGTGLTNSEDPFHQRQRRLIQPAFHAGRVARHDKGIWHISTSLANSWREGQEVAMERELYHLSIKFITRTLFSARSDDGIVTGIIRALPVVARGIMRQATVPVRLLNELPTPGNRRADAAGRWLRSCLGEVITDYRSRGIDNGDVLSMLLNARDKETGETMTDEQVVDEVLTILLAGAETTANGLTWACHLLSHHPEAQRRLSEEVDEVLSGRPFEHVDLAELEYTRRVLSETLRLYPPVWMLSRQASTDVRLGGHVIPAGSEVFISVHALHRDPLLYPEPTRFNPDRWLTWPEDRIVPRTEFLPFGAGNRSCVGEGLAWAEMTIFLSVLFRQWTLRPVSDRSVRQHASAMALRTKQLPMTVHRR
jgi:cytochrome P450